MSFNCILLLLMTQAIYYTTASNVEGSHVYNTPTCRGTNCRVCPGNEQHIQDILKSNTVVEFEKGDYCITQGSDGGFIQVQHVSNLTIIGHGIESQILCSQNTQFGFYFNNVSNVSIFGISFVGCSAPVSKSLLKNIPLTASPLCESSICSEKTNISTSLLIVDSENITISNFTAKRFPGFAIIATNDKKPNIVSKISKCDSTNKHIVINHSDLSLNKQGSVIFHEIAGTLSYGTFNNNMLGILFSNSDICLKDAVLTGTPIMSSNSRLSMRGSSIFCSSPINFIYSYLIFQNSHIKFSNIFESRNAAALTILEGRLNIYTNSSIEFVDNTVSSNASVFVAVSSSINIQDSARLVFTNNTARNLASILYALNCEAYISDSALILFEKNSVNNAQILSASLSSNWTLLNNSSIVFYNNTAIDYGRIAEISRSNLRTYNNASIVFKSNLVKCYSGVFIVHNATINLHGRSQLSVSNNSAEAKSDIVQTLEIVGCKCNSNAKMEFTGNFVTQQSHILISSPTPVQSILKNDTERLLYYESIIQYYYRVYFIWDNMPSGKINEPFSPIFPKLLTKAMWIANGSSTITFNNNLATNNSDVFSCIKCHIYALKTGLLLFANNNCSYSSHAFLMENTNITFEDSTSILLNNNTLVYDSSALLSRSSHWILNTNTTFAFTENTAKRNSFIAILFSVRMELSGEVLVQNNVVIDFGVISAMNSELFFQGRLQCQGNQAESGAIDVENSNIYFTKDSDACFLNNTAENGGAMTMVASVMHISPNTIVNFTHNQAHGLGGAVYIINPRNDLLYVIHYH